MTNAPSDTSCSTMAPVFTTAWGPSAAPVFTWAPPRTTAPGASVAVGETHAEA
jgi:hypothetical protein